MAAAAARDGSPSPTDKAAGGEGVADAVDGGPVAAVVGPVVGTAWSTVQPLAVGPGITAATPRLEMYRRAGYSAPERYNDNPYAQRWFEKHIGTILNKPSERLETVKS